MPRPKLDLAGVDVIPRLPHFIAPERGQDLPPGIVGSRIVKFGTVAHDIAWGKSPALEGGGLVIHYVPDGETETRIAGFSMSEEGMWTAFTGVMPDSHSPAQGPASASESCGAPPARAEAKDTRTPFPHTHTAAG